MLWSEAALPDSAQCLARDRVARIAPVAGETTWSLLCRVAARYGLEPHTLLGSWQWHNNRPRHRGGAERADAEVLFNRAGWRVLAGLCGVDQEVLRRALPSCGRPDDKLQDGEELPQGRWRAGGAVVGPVAFGCRLCVARRTGQAVRAVRYVPRWQRVCVRHGRWLLDADADQPLEHLDLRGVAEVVGAQRRWPGVARRAARAGVEPEQAFALAHAVVCRWWDQALHWDRERIWPARLHRVAGGDAGADLWRWRAVGRDAVIFPEVVAVAEAVVDPVMAQLVWADSGGERARPLGDDGAFCRRLGQRVGREWLRPLSLGTGDHSGPLLAWMGAILRRYEAGGPSGYDDPWRVRQEDLPATMAGQVRVMAAEARSGGSGTRWRATVSAEERFHLTQLVVEAGDQLVQLRGVHSGTTAEVARALLEGLSHSAVLIDEALVRTAAAAVAAGVALEEVAQWSRLPARELAQILAAERAGG